MVDAADEKVITLTMDEISALVGLPHLQVVLYVVGLRWWMDVSTGRVGEKRGISLQGLSDALFVEPAPGRVDSGSPSRKAIRHALDQLEKHGLIRPCGNGEVLVFSLPKAGGISVRPKLKGHKRGTGSGHAMGHAEMPVDSGFGGGNGAHNGAGVNLHNGAHLRSKSKPFSVVAIAAAQPYEVDANLLLLPFAPDRLAEWIRQSERARGVHCRVVARDVDGSALMGSGVAPDDVVEAYRLAVLDREAQQNPAPMNVPFIEIHLRRVLKSRSACRGGGVRSPAVVSGSAFGESVAEAGRLGIDGVQDGESEIEFISRVALSARALTSGISLSDVRAAGARLGGLVADFEARAEEKNKQVRAGGLEMARNVLKMRPRSVQGEVSGNA